jgi:AraC-like DNA-binding protein
MVSLRCKMAVKAALEELHLHHGVVELGEVEVLENMTAAQHEALKVILERAGLVLMDDKKAILIEKIKQTIIEMVHHSIEFPKVKNSDYLSEKLNQDYNQLANFFSESTGITIEQFIIAHKIERAKEMLMYEDMSLTQISYKLNYSSVAHLSNQFKKITGLTPSFFKQVKQKKLSTIQNV